MFNLTLAASYILSGFFMKISDDEYDEKNNKTLAIIFGIICGAFTAVASSLSHDAACIFIAILIGNILALKVDGIHHIVTMLSFLIIFIILGFPSFTYLSVVIIIACILGAIIDEKGNDNEKLYEKSKFLMYFFDFRFTLKVVILILAILGLVSIWTLVYFILFEIAYEIARRLFERFIL